MTGWFQGIRAKFYGIFAGSIAGAVLTIVIVQSLLGRFAGWDAEQAEERYSFLYAAFFLLLTVIYFYLLSRRMLARIGEIRRTLAVIQAGNLDVHMTDAASDEIGELARSVNAMSASLRHSIERELRSERMRSEMVAGISHDLRTPLTSLSGYLGLLRGSLRHDLDASEEYAGICERKSRELTERIEELLAYSLRQYAAMPLRRELISARALAEQVMIDFIPRTEEEGVEWVIEGDGRVLVSADPKLLARVLHNLIDNGLTYGKEGGLLRITIRHADRKRQVELAIINYGPPIDVRDLPHIFDWNYRGRGASVPHADGNGIGLASARQIAELHDGRLEVASDSRETVFRLILPVPERAID
ncbi:sensor histidine kinase [Paenibacillus aurantiacus]|uniref:histidine kinase n=1 Tax=Paenibacillus aurantiacus TaxID=1936118 RepID=A0ABV5KXQ4_9BACL